MTLERKILQVAPWPDDLEDLVKTFRYKPGWIFRLVPNLDRDYEPMDHNQERPAIGHGTTLIITSLTYNSYREYSPSDPPDYRVNHYKIVPPATFTRQAWKRWLLDQCLEVEQHEACEFARFVYSAGPDAGGRPTLVEERPWAPLHGPGENPYVIHELSTQEQRSTSFRGTMNP